MYGLFYFIFFMKPSLYFINIIFLSQDEWQIMFDLILYWPSILKKSIIDIKSGRPKLHLIFDFLKKIATNFSQYYHRTKVLVVSITFVFY